MASAGCVDAQSVKGADTVGAAVRGFGEPPEDIEPVQQLRGLTVSGVGAPRDGSASRTSSSPKSPAAPESR